MAKVKKASPARLKQYADLLVKAKAFEVPKFKAGDAESVLRELYAYMGGPVHSDIPFKIQLEVWGGVLLQEGFVELQTATKMQQSVFIFMLWLDIEERRSRELKFRESVALHAGVK